METRRKSQEGIERGGVCRGGENERDRRRDGDGLSKRRRGGGVQNAIKESPQIGMRGRSISCPRVESIYH